MTAKANRFLQVPQGTETIYLEEAYRHRQASQEINRLFTSWGYLPVETPVFDFFDIYQELVNSEKDIYRLIDREGDLLMLRSDITLFLAKQMGLSLKEEDLPARVCYSGTILRHQNREDISKNEFFQTGVELIGKEDRNADLEILMLLNAVFKTLEISPAVHIGSRKLINAAVKDFNPKDRREILDYLQKRNFPAFEEKLSRTMGPERSRNLSALFRFIGTKEELDLFLRDSRIRMNDEEKESLAELKYIMDKLEELGASEQFTVDLSEIGSQSYYTGIVFQGYMDGVDSAIASGGRYDNLLGKFGFDSPSIGFSLLLRKIEDHLGKKFNLPEASRVDNMDFAEALREAEKIRQTGRIAIL